MASKRAATKPEILAKAKTSVDQRGYCVYNISMAGSLRIVGSFTSVMCV
jgi:hypothetical protein